jgi:hypothetical protein
MSQMGPTTAVISALALGPLHLSQPTLAARRHFAFVPKAVISCRSLDHLIGPLLLVGAGDELRISVLQGDAAVPDNALDRRIVGSGNVFFHLLRPVMRYECLSRAAR